MKLKVLILLGLMYSCFMAQAQFQLTYDHAGGLDGSRAISFAEDGYLMASTGALTDIGQIPLSIVRYNLTGEVIDSTVIGCEGCSFLAYNIMKFSAHTYYVSGIHHQESTNEYSLYLAKVKDNADTVWTKKFDECNCYEVGWFTQPSQDGKLLFGGGTQDSVVLFKLDTNGSIIWKEKYGNAYYQEARQLSVLSDGNYMLGGYSVSTAGAEFDGMIIKTRSNGDIIWQQSYGTAGKHESIADMYADTDTSVIVVGQKNLSGRGAQGWVARIDSSGDILWQRNYGGSGSETFWKMDVQQDGNIWVASHLQDGIHVNAWLLCLSPLDGDTLWTRTFTYEGTKHNLYSDYFWDIKCTPDGGAILSGMINNPTTPSGTQDSWIMKVDSMGNCPNELCYPWLVSSGLPLIYSQASIYPNPASGQITIEAPQELVGNSRLLLYNSLGQQVSSTAITAPKQTINLNGLAAGIYLYRLNTSKGVVSTGQLLLE